jgi:formylglycine-generating enzyme required for sulfatase activity
MTVFETVNKNPQASGPTGSTATPPPAPGAAKRSPDSPPPPAIAPFDAQQARAHQAAWARHLRTPIALVSRTGIPLVLIPPGEFLMGSTDEQVEATLEADAAFRQIPIDRIPNSERPQHRVVITKPFLVGATEVTVGQFKKFAAAKGYRTEAEQAKQTHTYLNPGYVITGDSPTSAITWNDAAAYCNWLSEQEKATYRLPTEAEWEYACRAGTTTQFSFGDDAAMLDSYGWFGKNADGCARAVGLKSANAFDLFDMHGNAREWCQDFYDEKWYEKTQSHDPTGPSSGFDRVVRGGYWNDNASNCGSACRFHRTAGGRYNYSGFRVVRVW